MERLKPIAIIDSRDEKRWHEKRAGGVTKTDAVRLVAGGIRTREAIREEKQGRGSFRGNAATERGHRLEPVALAWAEAQLGIPASGILYSHGANGLHLATPDAFLWDDGEGALVEVKTHTEDWSRRIPLKIKRDIWWQMYVLGAGYAALVHWQVDKNGQPLTMEPKLIEIDENPDETAKLIQAADDYLEWVAAGCPVHDAEEDLPSAVVEAIRQHVAAKAQIADAEKVIRDYIAETKSAAITRDLPGGSLAWSTFEASEFDKAAWAAAEPEAAAAWSAAQEKYRKKRPSSRLTITAPKEAA